MSNYEAPTHLSFVQQAEDALQASWEPDCWQATTLAEPSRKPASGLPAREAAIAYAVATNPDYVDLFCEQLAELRFSSPLAERVVNAALQGKPIAESDVATLRFGVSAPVPRYLKGHDPEALRGTLELHAEADRRMALRAMS